jgi:hypothetical protein
MASYLTLALELRQQILFEAFALADGEDLFALEPMRRYVDRLTEENISLPIRQHAQVRLSEDPEDSERYSSVRPLWYTPAADQLVRTLLRVHATMREDMAYVVDTWYACKQPYGAHYSVQSLTTSRANDHSTRTRTQKLFKAGIDHGIKRYHSAEVAGPYICRGSQDPFLPRCWSSWLLGFAFETIQEESAQLWHGEPNRVAKVELEMIVALYDEGDGWDQWETYMNRWRRPWMSGGFYG